MRWTKRNSKGEISQRDAGLLLLPTLLACKGRKCVNNRCQYIVGKEEMQQKLQAVLHDTILNKDCHAEIKYLVNYVRRNPLSQMKCIKVFPKKTPVEGATVNC